MDTRYKKSRLQTAVAAPSSVQLSGLLSFSQTGSRRTHACQQSTNVYAHCLSRVLFAEMSPLKARPVFHPFKYEFQHSLWCSIDTDCIQIPHLKLLTTIHPRCTPTPTPTHTRPQLKLPGHTTHTKSTFLLSDLCSPISTSSFREKNIQF